MPNHVQNVLNFNSKEDMEKVMKSLSPEWDETKEDKILNFEWLIPLPKTKEECDPAFVLPEGDSGQMDHEAGKEWFNWYNWQVTNWGTKWNAYETFISGNSIWFQTAWSPPIPVIAKLAEMLPEGIEVGYQYSEEQGPIDCGEARLTKENFDLDEFPSESDEAYEMANYLWGDYWYKCEDENWHTEYDKGSFYDENNDLHFFDLENLSEETAKEMHLKYGKQFDDMIIEALEEDNLVFLEKTIGFERLENGDYKVDAKSFVTDFSGADNYSKDFSEAS